MKATVTYRLSYEPHPWNERRRADGTRAWVILEVTTPELGLPTEEPVAIFNFDSQAERFMAHVHAGGLNGVLLSIDPQWAEMFALLQRRNAGHKPRDTGGEG